MYRGNNCTCAAIPAHPLIGALSGVVLLHGGGVSSFSHAQGRAGAPSAQSVGLFHLLALQQEVVNRRRRASGVVL
eukprot:6694439-Pyramimonas_sp.AAC.1